MSRQERISRIETDGPLAMAHQCRLLSLPRSAHCRPEPQPSALDLAIMRRIDALHMRHPAYGPRKISGILRLKGIAAGRRKVRRLMRGMGIAPSKPKPWTSVKAPDHKVFPCRLQDVEVTEPNQAWCSDITHIPMSGGFMFLVAVMDWATRFVLAWRLSSSMAVEFCLDALHDALPGDVAPGIFNTDQGSQFTSDAFTDAVLASGVLMSMDGRGRCLDNVFIERLWGSLKREAVHRHELTNGLKAHQVMGDWFEHYNGERPHESLGGLTPRMAYEGIPMPPLKTADEII